MSMREEESHTATQGAQEQPPQQSQRTQPPGRQSSSTKSSTTTNECIELKNLKYKSMMLKNNQKRGDAAMQMLHNTSATDSVSNIEKYLDRERSHKANEPWGKLDKTVKLSKLHAFAKKYIQENTLPDGEINSLVAYLSTCIDHKKIVKTKDVVYDKTTGTIVSIPILTHLHGPGPILDSVKFTLRRCDKRPSTLKSLPSHSSHTLTNNHVIPVITSTTTTTTTSTSTSTTS
jgi:hypothetical protein